MLKINNEEYQVLTATIKFIDSIHNKTKGYSILISLDIELNKIKGYISFYVDFFDIKDFEKIENKIYKELPTEFNSKITMIEIYDTKNFIDYINSDILIKFSNIENNKIEMCLKINDKLIKLDYQGKLSIQY